MFSWLRKEIESRMPGSRVARRIVTLASGTAMAQIITICAMPVVTRLYTPTQMGVLSIFLSFFGFWTSTLSLRYEYAILITRDDVESHVVHRLGLILVFGMSILAFPVLWSLHHANLLGFGLLPAWASLVAIPILMGYGIFMVYRSWALRAGLVREITGASIARAVAGSVTQVLFGFFSAGVAGLFVAQFTASWATMLHLARAVRAHYSTSRPLVVGRADLVAVARRYSKFPVFEAPSAWIDQLGMLLPVPLIASQHGAAAAGWFGLARMIVGVPNSQIGSAVADVFQMEIASAVIAQDYTRVKNLFYRLARKLALIGFLPFALLAVLAVWLVPLIFGEDWVGAGIAAALIVPWMYVALIVSPLSRILSVLQVQELKLVYDVSSVIFLLGAFYVSKINDFSFSWTVASISIAQIMGYVVYALVQVSAVNSRIRPA